MPIIGVIASSAKGAPGVPTSVSAVNVGSGRAFNNGRADISFTPGAGATATSFTVTSSPGGFTGTGASSPISVTGLQSNTAYTFTVTATNAAGTSDPSAASNSITATTVPQAPTIGTATAGSGSATVTFTANATGGSAITGFTATSSPGSITGTNTTSPITVSGLTNGTAYTFTVTASNANGTSLASAASNSVTPTFIYWIENFDTATTDAIVGMTIANSNAILVNTSSSDAEYTILNFQGGKIAGRLATPIFPERFNAFGGIVAEPTFGGLIMFGQGRTDTSFFDNPSWFGFNSSGNISNARVFNALINQGFGAFNASANRGGVSFASGEIPNPTRACIASFDSSATALAYRRLDGSGSGSSICVNADTNGRGWVGWRRDGVPQVGVTSSLAVLQWQRTISGDTTVYAVASFSTSTPYVAVVDKGSTNIVLVAFDSNGNTLWQRSITGISMSALQARTIGACMDSDGNTYLALAQSNTLNNLFKYNSSGTLLFQRSFTHNELGAMTYLSTLGTDLIMAERQGIPRNIMRYPTDGSLTGTYSYRGSSLVIAASSATSATASLTITNVTPSDESLGTGSSAYTVNLSNNTTSVQNRINL